MSNGNERFLIAVYDSPHDENRRILWEELKNIIDDNHNSWLVAGDFNDIVSP
jgi:endonuclease/exonuclease/phosphatase (EEP) superfamily protein YafD